MKLRLLFATLLTFAALGAPVIAQPTTDPDILQGDITIVDGGDLKSAIAGAIETDNDDLGVAIGDALTEATDQLAAGGSAGGVFTSKSFITLLFGVLGAAVTYFSTNGIKLSSEAIRGNRTRIIAALISTVTAGVGGYFGLSEVTGVTGVEGALLAGLSTVSSLLIAVGVHEGKRQAQTGKRHPERKHPTKADDVDFRDTTAGKLTVMGLKAFATSVGVPPFVVDTLVTYLPLEEVETAIEEMGKERALTQSEIEADQDRWKAENPVTEEELEQAQGKLRLHRHPQVAEVSNQEEPDRDPFTEGNQQ